jgi:hypothetical protein
MYMCASKIGCVCVPRGQDVYVFFEDRMCMCGSRIGLYVFLEERMYICGFRIGCTCVTQG